MAKNIKVNAFASILVRVFNILFPLITGPYLARILSKDAYGDFNIANTMIGVFIPFAAFGIYGYGVRAISRVKNNKEEISKNFTSLFIINIFTSVSVGLLYVLYVFLNVDSSKFLLYFALGIQIFSQFIYIEWMNEAFENYGFILFKTLFIRILMLVMIFNFVRTENDIVNYAFVMSFINFVNYFTSFVYIKRKVNFSKISFHDVKVHIKPLLGMVLLTNANMLYTVLDRTMLSTIGAKIEVSYYTFSQSIAQLITSIVYSIIMVSLPRLSYYFGTSNEKDYKNLVNQVSQTFLFFVIPMGVGLACISTEVMVMYSGLKYVEAGLILKIFSFRILLWSLDQLVSNQILFVKGYEKVITTLYFLGGIINLVLNYLLVVFKFEKAEYFVLTTIIAEVIVVTLIIIFIQKNKLFDLKIILKNYLKYTLCALPFLIITYGINSFMGVELRGIALQKRTFLIMLSSGLYYMTIMFILKDEIFMMTLRQVKGRLRKFKIN